MGRGLGGVGGGGGGEPLVQVGEVAVAVKRVS